MQQDGPDPCPSHVTIELRNLLVAPSTTANRRAGRSSSRNRGFSLIELLVVLSIIAILAAATVSVIPSLLQGNQLDANVATLSGVLDEAREAAIAGNTYVWVAFANPTTSLSGGVAVVVFESQDGTDPLNGFSTTFATISSANNFLVINNVVHLPGTQVTASGALTVASYPTLSRLPTVSPAAASLQSPLTLTLVQGGTTYTFTQAIEFTPDGESKVQSWNNWVEMGLKSSLATTSKDAAVFRIAKLTGKVTVYH
jgi:prepilin-type N-terminal cleavage/methylation domain-containing protein